MRSDITQQLLRQRGPARKDQNMHFRSAFKSPGAKFLMRGTITA